MRPTACLLATLAILAPTLLQAQDIPRAAPQSGASFRIENTLATTIGDGQSRAVTITSEQRVTASLGGTAWQATITSFRADDATRAALSPAEYQACIAGRLKGTDTYHAFLLTHSEVPDTCTPAKPDGLLSNPDAVPVKTSDLECSWPEFEAFFPLGQRAAIILRCTREYWRSTGPNLGPSDVLIDIQDNGPAVARIASGEYPVRRLNVTETEGRSVSIRTILFSEHFGRSIVTEGTTTFRDRPDAPEVVTTSHAEATPLP